MLVVYVTRNELSYSRMGMSVSKKIGNAVMRKYVRRKIREAYRTQKSDLPVGYDLICIARPKAADKKIDLSNSLRTLVIKAVRMEKTSKKK